jgi:GTP-binding protein
MARSPVRRKRLQRGGLPVAGPGAGRIPFVAIVGRPNAGKSTLFNRLVRSPLSIVDATPGVTRDRIFAEVALAGRPAALIDTGGVEAEDHGHGMAERIRVQVQVAIEEADVVICLFDGRGTAGADDARVVGMLREAGRPVVWAANKVDAERDEPGASEYYRLGVEPLHFVSAASGRGVGALLDAVLEHLPPADRPDAGEEALPDETPVSGDDEEAEGGAAPIPVPRVAVIGRPNAGKSTLVNRLLGEERMLVDDVPGTTRDAVDARVETPRGPLVLIDTAGLRRRARVAGRLEHLSALSAVRALERCHVALLVVDGAAEPGADQDRRLLGLAAERGRALIVVANKIDAVPGDRRRELVRTLGDAFIFAPWAPVVLVSARSGRGVPELLAALFRVHEAFNRRIPTGELNRFLAELTTRHSPPLHRNLPVNLLYATQSAVRPPGFLLFSNRPQGWKREYVRYLENRLRERYDLAGCPVRIRFRRGRDGA